MRPLSEKDYRTLRSYYLWDIRDLLDSPHRSREEKWTRQRIKVIQQRMARTRRDYYAHRTRYE